MRVSMTESGNPKNAQAERINNTMKNELLKDKVFTNISDAIAAVAVDFYNNRRDNLDITEKSLPLDHCLGSPSGLRPPINPRQ